MEAVDSFDQRVIEFKYNTGQFLQALKRHHSFCLKDATTSL
jgi:hypothetical protein